MTLISINTSFSVRCNADSSPPPLESNWINETKKFFHQSQLEAKAWTPNAWAEDKSLTTVWIVRDTLLHLPTVNHHDSHSNFVTCVNAEDVQLLSLFWDEAHLGCRSRNSDRAKAFRWIADYAEFVSLISATLFPLGPIQDGLDVLSTLGGPYHDPNFGRWKPEARLTLALLSESWDILVFRRLITPFYLCRTQTSTWQGRFIIDKVFSRPEVTVIDPEDEQYEQELLVNFRTLLIQKRAGRVNMNDMRLRSDELKLLSWSQVYKEWKEAKDNGRKGETELVFRDFLRKKPPTGRVKTLVQLVRTIRTQLKERFVIVTDRIFLAKLAVYVCSGVS